MNKQAWLMGVLLVVILVSGCAEKEAIVEPEVPPVVEQTQPEQTESKIREMNVPERDPFQVAVLTPPISEKGNPAEADGRDPFVQMANVVIEPEPTEDEPVVIPPIEEPVAITPGKVLVQLVTLDLVWLDVYVDNEQVFRGNVPSGRTLDFEAEAEVRLEQVGREWAPALVINGYNAGRLVELLPELQQGPVTLAEAGVQVSIEQRYAGGVLIGLRIRALGD